MSRWTFELQDRPDLHEGIPVGVIRDQTDDLLFVQFYPEWEEHRKARCLAVAAPDLYEAAKDAFNILDGAPCPVDDPEAWKRDVRRRLCAALAKAEE